MIKKILLTLLIAATPMAMASSVGAQKVDPFKDVCSGNSSATVCEEKKSTSGKNPIYGPDGILTTIINILSIIVGIVAVIGIMAAGLKFITSGSNPQQVTVAREMVLYAVVGLIIAASAQVLVRFIIGKVN